MTWLELTIQVLKELLASARSTFQTGFLSLKGRRRPKGDALYALIRRNTLQARLVGRTSYKCSDCNVGLCITPCFEIFHTVMHYEKKTHTCSIYPLFLLKFLTVQKIYVFSDIRWKWVATFTHSPICPREESPWCSFDKGPWTLEQLVWIWWWMKKSSWELNYPFVQSVVSLTELSSSGWRKITPNVLRIYPLWKNVNKTSDKAVPDAH
jgi:hypothetical protein